MQLLFILKSNLCERFDAGDLASKDIAQREGGRFDLYIPKTTTVNKLPFLNRGENRGGATNLRFIPGAQLGMAAKQAAEEWLAELEKDPKYRERKLARDEHFDRLNKLYEKDEEGLVRDLVSVGFEVESVWDFVDRENGYANAGPNYQKRLFVRAWMPR